MTPGWLLRAWDDALEENADHYRPVPLSLSAKGFRQPRAGKWLMEYPRFKSGLPNAPAFRYGALAVLSAIAVLLIPTHFLFIPFALGITSQLINVDVPDTHLGDALRAGGQKLNDWQFSGWSWTILAGAATYIGTIEQRITACVAAVMLFVTSSLGPTLVLIPHAMLPYNITLVTGLSAFHAAGGRLTREGGNPTVYELQAYGADSTGTTSQSASVQAAIDAVPVTGATVWASQGYYVLGTTITLPVDRLVIIEGIGDLGTNSGGLLSFGSVFKRLATFTSGPLFSQVAPGATTSAFGAHFRRIVLDGNNVAGDLLVQTQMQTCVLDHCTFFNSNGNGVLWTGIYNSYIDFCRFFELGNTVAHPNGTSALVLNSNNNANCVDIWITQPHFESGRGSYMTSYDPTGTHPIDGVIILGGKMEWSGNATTGFAPPAASAIGMPFLYPLNGVNWLVYGMVMINGFHANAIHISAHSCNGCRFYTNHETSTGLADNQLPTYFIDLFSGGNLYVSGIFLRGAQAGTSGAHIRVIESSVTGYQIDPGSKFISPASGVGIKFTNPTTGKASSFPASGGIRDKAFALTWGSAINWNADDGNHYIVTATSNIAATILAPSVLPQANQTSLVTFEIFNNSGGALTTPIAFAAGAGAFLASGGVSPANGFTIEVTFRYDQGRNRWIETARGAAV